MQRAGQMGRDGSAEAGLNFRLLLCCNVSPVDSACFPLASLPPPPPTRSTSYSLAVREHCAVRRTNYENSARFAMLCARPRPPGCRTASLPDCPSVARNGGGGGVDGGTARGGSGAG